jgi:hypothetical protein
MLHLNCAGCGEKVEVESMLASAEKICPHCGKYVIGGRTPRPAEPLDTPDRGALAPSSYAPRRSSRSSSAGATLAITGLAIVNFVFGGLNMCCGAGLFFMVDVLRGPEMNRAVQQGKISSHQLQQVRDMEPYFLIVMGVLVVTSVMLMGAGYGLLRRDSFSRWLNLGLAGMIGLLGIVALVTLGDFCSLILYGGYAGLAFAILLSFGDEFRPAEVPSAE